MPYRNPELADAMRSWLRQVGAFLAGKTMKSHYLMYTGKRLVVTHEGTWEEVEVPFDPSGLINDYREEIHQLSAYKTALNLLKTSPVLEELTGKFVGTDNQAVGIQWEFLLERFITEYGRQAKSLAYNEDTFSTVYGTFEEFVYGKNITRRLVAPLQFFASDLDLLDFAEGLSILLLTPELYERLYLEGGIFRDEYKTETRAIRQFVIWLEHSHPKIVRAPNEPPKIDEERWRAPDKRMQQLCTALRLFKKGSPRFRSIHEYHPWVGAGGRSYPSTTFPGGSTLELRSTEIDSFKAFLERMRHINFEVDKFLKVAIDRFNFALDRTNLEDKIIDLSISLEAMYLSGIGNEEERGNISYRFALHGARLLGLDLATRAPIFHDLKAVYRVRSRIVHGAADYKLPRKDGVPMTLKEFADKLEEYARSSIQRFVLRIGSTGESCRFNWEEMVLT